MTKIKISKEELLEFIDDMTYETPTSDFEGGWNAILVAIRRKIISKEEDINEIGKANK